MTAASTLEQRLVAPAPPTRVERVSWWLRRRADHRAGLVGIFVWAFAEALMWPIIPDASLALLVAARPRRWLALSASAVAGSVAGGVLGVTAGLRGWSWPLLLTTPRMREAVEGWFAAGPSGMAHQPLSGVPYKVFVAAAPNAGISPGEFALATLQYRAPRLVAVAAMAAVVGALGWRFVPPRRQALVHVMASVTGMVLLLAGLAAVVARWS